MDKLVRRTAMAERQVARKLAKIRRANPPERLPPESARREVRYHKAMARIARREDWELGPLAPNRDVPTTSLPRFRKPLKAALNATSLLDDEAPQWGSVNREIFRPSFKLLDWMKEERWKWAGGRKFPNLKVNDRVVVMEGPLKGQISKITEIDVDTACVQLESIGDSNVNLSHLMTPVGKAETMAYNMPSHIPVSAVRLVHPMTDPQTGVTRDVIIKHLVPRDIYFDKPTRKTTWARVVPDLNVEIPWPDDPPVEHKEHPIDTKRAMVEKKTWVPTLLKPPMPPQVLDELRNRFSIFRTRHTPEYIREKELEETKKRRRVSTTLAMRTPLQMLHKVQRDERRALGQPVLTDEMLRKIGAVMLRNRQRSMAAAGISDVSPDAAALKPKPKTPEGVVVDLSAVPSSSEETRPPPS